MRRSGTGPVMQKELRILFKSKRRIGLLFMMPLIIILVGGITGASTAIFEPTPKKVNVWVDDSNSTAITQSMVNLWQGINNTQFEFKSLDIQAHLADYDFAVMVYIPANFSNLLMHDLTANIAIYYNMNDTSYESIANSIARMTLVFQQQMLLQNHPNVNLQLIKMRVQAASKPTGGVEKEIAGVLLIIPVYLLIFLVIPPVSLVLISVTQEREQRTLEALFLQPVSRRSIIMGKIMYGMALVLMTLVGDIIAVFGAVELYVTVTKTQVSSGEAIDILGFLRDTVGYYVISLFVIAIALMAMLFISISVFLSLLAKDEKEANMISGVMPLSLFAMILVVVAIPIQSFSVVVQLILSALPAVGILVGMYLSLLAGEVALSAYVALGAQAVWVVVVIWLTTRVSESESILELSLSKAARELIHYIFRR